MNEDICVMASPDNHSFSYLFDCGMASRLSISDVMRIKAVFVTHTHVDHFVNFDAILRNRAGSREPVIITGPRGIAQNVQGKLQAYTWNLIGKGGSCFQVREIQNDQSYKYFRLCPPRWKVEFQGVEESKFLFELDKVIVEHCVLDHKIPSIAYRMREKNAVNIESIPFKPGPWIKDLKEAYCQSKPETILDIFGQQVPAGELFHTLKETPGYSVGYAMDHLGGGPNHEKLEVFFRGVDELFIESFFRHVDWSYARRHKHCTSYLSGKLAREAGVKRLHLVHHSRRYNEEIPDLIEEGMAAFEDREPNFQKSSKARFEDLDSTDHDL
jgi:ribonuclease Z